MGLPAVRKVPPSPLDLWNHRVSGKWYFKSWRSITCGQNLDVKELTLRARGINSRSGTKASSPTVTASTMIARLQGCAQGQMSHSHVEKKSLRAQPGRKIVSVEGWESAPFAKHASYRPPRKPEREAGKLCPKCGTAPLKAKSGLNGPLTVDCYGNGFTIRTPSISRAACISSEKSTLHPACLAERTIRASQKLMP